MTEIPLNLHLSHDVWEGVAAGGQLQARGGNGPERGTVVSRVGRLAATQGGRRLLPMVRTWRSAGARISANPAGEGAEKLET